MSDNSSDESSDDGLLDSPVFAKKKRSETRAENAKLNFMAQCLKGSDARTDVHKRINEVDIEFGLKTEESVEDNEEEGDEGNGGDKMEVDDGDLKPSAKDDKDKDGAPTAEGDDSKKETCTNTDNAAEDEVTKTESFATATTSATTITKDPQTTNNKQEVETEDAFWARMNSFAESNEKKTPGTRDVHLARKQLTDAVSGLNDYTSDMTDDENNIDGNDGHNAGMTREQLRFEAEAKSQGAYSNLGLRHMFHPSLIKKGDTAADTGTKKESHTFNTRQEAMTELKTVVLSLQRQHTPPQTKSDKALRKFFIDPLIKLLKKQPQYNVWDMLNDFLTRNPVLNGKFVITLPESFCKWMWKLACSSYDVGRLCSNTCCNLIQKYVANNVDVDEQQENGSFRADTPFLTNLKMDDLVSCLVNNFGLWTKPRPIKLPKPEKDENDDPMDTSNDDEDEDDEKDTSASVDVYALKNTLLIWMSLFNRNLIKIQDDEALGKRDDKTEESGADAARLLAAITRVGIDPSCNMAADINYDTCGEPLPILIQKLTASLVKTTTSQLSQKFDKARVNQWIEQTAIILVEACSDLESGDEDTADCDDEDGDLALAMAVKRMGWCDFDNSYSPEIAQVKMLFAEKALHKCLPDVTDWETQVKDRTEYYCKDWNKDNTDEFTANRRQLQHVIKALVTPEVGLQWIDDEAENFVMSNQPCFLAAVIIAGECSSVGVSIYWRVQNDFISEEGGDPVFTVQEKDTVFEIASNIEDLCDGLKKECRAVIAYPHLRRAKEYLTRLTKKLSVTKGKSSKGKRKKREQGSLDSYFCRTPSQSQAPEADDYEDSQEPESQFPFSQDSI